MSLAEFVARYLGKAVDVDGVYGPQCVDLVNAWAMARGKPRLTGNAYQLLAQASPTIWLRTGNTPTNVPPAGAIVVWRADVASAAIGDDGHTAICLLADSLHLITADQNWAGHQYVTINVHTFDGVIGWLTPR